jgi:hypothetical protein
MTSRMFAVCLDALCELTCLNDVTLIWLPEHCGIFGNEVSDRFVRQALDKPLLNPESALGIHNCLTREVIKN